MSKISFVILHYENLLDTEECLESLLLQANQDFDIVVVDNGSTRGKIENINSKYKHNNKIHIIRSEENLGFARGNNIGFLFAKEKLNAKVIVLANNDLIFRQNRFVDILTEIDNREEISIAGPQIISLVDGKNQNPVPVLFSDLNDVNKHLLKMHVLKFLNIFGADVLIKNQFSDEVQEYHPNAEDDFQIHGACMIFGPLYVNRFNGLYNGTFMYSEEDILKKVSELFDIPMKYYDELQVYHKEGSSTSMIFSRGKAKRRFFYRWSIDSTKQLKRIMKTHLVRGME